MDSERDKGREIRRRRREQRLGEDWHRVEFGEEIREEGDG